jgi:hypothetical protein
MNATVCRVAELERQTLAVMDAQDAAERAGQETGASDARARVAALREAQTHVVATSEHGVILQLLERYIAADEGDDAKVERLDALMREAVDRLAVDALMPEAA